VHQLPRNAGRFGDAGADLDAQVGELVAHGEPESLRVRIGREDLLIQLDAALANHAGDLLDHHRLGDGSLLQVVL